MKNVITMVCELEIWNLSPSTSYFPSPSVNTPIGGLAHNAHIFNSLHWIRTPTLEPPNLEHK
jgi:hypothetical protein